MNVANQEELKIQMTVWHSRRPTKFEREELNWKTMAELRKIAPSGSTYCQRDATFFYKIEDGKVFFFIDNKHGWQESGLTPDLFPNDHIAEL